MEIQIKTTSILKERSFALWFLYMLGFKQKYLIVTVNWELLLQDEIHHF